MKVAQGLHLYQAAMIVIEETQRKEFNILPNKYYFLVILNQIALKSFQTFYEGHFQRVPLLKRSAFSRRFLDSHFDKTGESSRWIGFKTKGRIRVIRQKRSAGSVFGQLTNDRRGWK